MSVPIVLVTNNADRAALAGKTSIALKNLSDEIMALMSNIEIFEHIREGRWVRSLGVTDARYPQAMGSPNSSDYPRVITDFKYGIVLDEFHPAPAHTREECGERNVDVVFVYKLLNPNHGHS